MCSATRDVRFTPESTAVYRGCDCRGGFSGRLTLKKIVPNLVQLGDCQLEWRDKEMLILTSNEPKGIKRLERIGNLEINIDRKVFCEPRLDTACNVGRRWRYLRLADEM